MARPTTRPTYLAGVQDASAVPVTVITNPRNVGFPAAVNQGLQAASGEYLVLLNNDAVVTEGWLDQLDRAEPRLGRDGRARRSESRKRKDAETTKRTATDTEGMRQAAAGGRTAPGGLGIGLVGPMSNYATPPQLVEDVPYRDLDEMHAFAGRWRERASRAVVHRRRSSRGSAC